MEQITVEMASAVQVVSTEDAKLSRGRGFDPIRGGWFHAFTALDFTAVQLRVMMEPVAKGSRPCRFSC